MLLPYFVSLPQRYVFYQQVAVLQLIETCQKLSCIIHVAYVAITAQFGKEKIVSNPTCSFFDLRE